MNLFHNVCVATDHIAIKELIEKEGGIAIMTDPKLPSGTDRIISALAQMGESYDHVVNVQGDEALISESHLGPLVSYLQANDFVEIATLCVKNESEVDFKNPNCVKLVKALDNRVLYFSRASIPHDRDGITSTFNQHVGVYAFSADAIETIKELEESRLEKLERLEQLRWMEAGMTIYACEVEGKLIGVDMEEDVLRVEELL